MDERDFHHRLVAVRAADVAGYTRLMEENSNRMVTAWRAARADVIDPAIAGHSGRIVKHTGDGFLAEYPSVREAVDCALELQQGLADSFLDFRIGVHLGDVIDDGDAIHSEGVNLAARLEALARPGSVCVSADVFRAVKHRISATGSSSTLPSRCAPTCCGRAGGRLGVRPRNRHRSSQSRQRPNR